MQSPSTSLRTFVRGTWMPTSIPPSSGSASATLLQNEARKGQAPLMQECLVHAAAQRGGKAAMSISGTPQTSFATQKPSLTNTKTVLSAEQQHAQFIQGTMIPASSIRSTNAPMELIA